MNLTIEKLLQVRAEFEKQFGKEKPPATLVSDPNTKRKIAEEFPERDPVGLGRIAGLEIIPLEGMPEDQCLVFSDRKAAHAFVNACENMRDLGVNPKAYIEAHFRMAKSK